MPGLPMKAMRSGLVMSADLSAIAQLGKRA
jgi:hypothetical protein